MTPITPYGSARDLPSYQEMARLIQGGKLLTRFVARNQRSGFLKIEQQLNHLVASVDRFYARLGPQNWIFHESLNVSAVEAILDQTSTCEEAEQRFIELYRDEANLGFWTRRLRDVEGLRERAHQIERAREHYCAGQFDSTALHLIAVMDGFVNDFEPDRRHGLAFRHPDAMTAWDSVVGHHLGLTNALKAYGKPIKKRVDEEVYQLHRHGIVHGTITRFDNVVVATKAWNMLFALVDWAAASGKAREPETPKPTFRGIVRQIVTTARMKARMAGWEPSRLSVSDARFEDHEIHKLTVEFLTSWRDRNFGTLARFPSRRFDKGEATLKRIAGRLREDFEGFVLSKFRVTELDNTVPAIWLSSGEATVNGTPGFLSAVGSSRKLTAASGTAPILRCGASYSATPPPYGGAANRRRVHLGRRCVDGDLRPAGTASKLESQSIGHARWRGSGKLSYWTSSRLRKKDKACRRGGWSVK